MVSQRARQSVENALQRALSTTLALAPEDVCTIVPAAGPWVAGQGGESLFVITVSSFVFRLLTLFQVAATPASRAYYLEPVAEGQTFDEAFREIVNLCCGALNRELSQHLPHLAMSIPYTLSSRCLDFLGDLQPNCLLSRQITINDTVQLQVTVCLCCSAPLDFAVSDVPAEHSAGELELL